MANKSIGDYSTDVVRTPAGYWDLDYCREIINDFELVRTEASHLLAFLDHVHIVHQTRLTDDANRPTSVETRKLMTTTSDQASLLSGLLSKMSPQHKASLTEYSGLRGSQISTIQDQLMYLSYAAQLASETTQNTKAGRKRTPLLAALYQLKTYYKDHTDSRIKGRSMRDFIIRCVEPLGFYSGLDYDAKVDRVQDHLRKLR